MSSKLTRYRLGELIDVTRGQSLSGEYYASQGKYIRLTLANFDYQNGGFKSDVQKDDLYYTGNIKPRCILNEGDIITPLTEQTPGLLGSTARIPVSGLYVQSGDVALVKCNKELIDPSFCYYLLPSLQVKKQLSAGSQQTKIRHTNPDAIKNCIVDIPDIEQQKKIGRLLDSISAKIDENHKQNSILERLAKQLYDYWFVQFDFPDENGCPYKSSGGKMVWNEKLKREIPEGWEIKKNLDCFNIFTGKKDVSKVIPGAYKFFSCAPDSITSNDYICDNKVILISGNGSYTGRVSYYNGKCDLYQRTYGCTLKENDNFMPFFYYTMKYIFQPLFSGGKHGSSIPYIVLGDLADFSFVWNEKIIGNFCDIISHSFLMSKEMIPKELENLDKMKSQLLPLLMSGQVTIKD